MTTSTQMSMGTGTGSRMKTDVPTMRRVSKYETSRRLSSSVAGVNASPSGATYRSTRFQPVVRARTFATDPACSASER